MISNLVIYSSAIDLIKRYGSRAPLYASTRTNQLVNTGDVTGQLVWEKIGAAVEELLIEEVPRGVRTH